MSFGDIQAAIRMREVFTGIAEGVVERLRPAERIGKVYSYNVQSQTAKIYFPGETTSSLANVRFALDKIPSKAMTETFSEMGYDAVADIVRIAGQPGAYYILDFVAGIPQPYAVDLATGVVTNPHQNPSFDNIFTSTQGNGSTPRSIPSGWDFFWGGGLPEVAYASDSTTWNGATGYSLKMTFTGLSGIQRALTTMFQCKPGSTITVRVKSKSSGPALHIGVFSGTTNNFGFFDGDPNTVWQTSGDIVPPNDSIWREYSYVCQQPAGRSKAYITISGTTASGGLGSIWFDEVEITVDETPPPVYIKTGFIIQWSGVNLPDDDYFWCRGGTFSSVDYPELASIVGDTYGTHSGTTYYLPDYRARSPIGIGGAAVGGGSGGNVYSLGQKHGDERLQEHVHGGTVNAAAHAYAYGFYPESVYGQNYGAQLGGGYVGRIAVWDFQTDVTHSHGLTIEAAGGGLSQNVHPVLGTNFIIKN